MKTLSLSITLLLVSAHASAQDNVNPDDFLGEWSGTGMLLGSEATYEMEWRPVLDGQFIRLEFQSTRTSSDGGVTRFKGHSYFRITSDSTYTGEWFDNRGLSFPIEGSITENSLISNWGTPEIEQGRTIYTLVSPGEIEVTDYVLREDNYVKFGEALYQTGNEIKSEQTMKRVTGIGGLFFKSENPGETKEWYKKHLGIESGQYGGTFEWRHAENPDKKGFTAWSPFSMDTNYYDPSKKDFMFNYRVDDLEKLLETLEEEGVEIVGEMETYEYGKFGWIMDPNGIKIELWEPNDVEYDKIKGEVNKSS